MFQSRFGKIDEFSWWDLEGISEDAGTQFTSMDFQDKFQTHGVQLMLADLKNQEMKEQIEVTWRKLRTITHALMVHASVLETVIHFALMYRACHISRYYQPKT